MPSRPLLLHGGRVLRTGCTSPERLDVLIGPDGRIERLDAIEPASAKAEVVDVAGTLVIPGFVDVHQHLDKTRTRDAIRNPAGTLAGAIAGFNEYAATLSYDDLARRAERTLRACIAHGTIAIRTHANVDTVLRHRALEMLVQLREQWKQRIRLQIVAFITAGAARLGACARSLVDDAVRAGADVIGGTPAIADDPPAFLRMLFDASEAHGLPIDLHLDEHLDASRQLFDAVTALSKTRKTHGRVAVGHCSALSAMPRADAQRVIDGFAEAGIAVITLPAANLFLQGRDAEVLPPRGLTRVKELVAAGVRVAAGSDNIQDPFVPVGTGDMLEIARWTLLAGHLGASDLDQAFAMVTNVPAEIMAFGRDYGLHVGGRADLVVSEAEDVRDLVASGPPIQAVLLQGRPVHGQL